MSPRVPIDMVSRGGVVDWSTEKIIDTVKHYLLVEFSSIVFRPTIVILILECQHTTNGKVTFNYLFSKYSRNEDT